MGNSNQIRRQQLLNRFDVVKKIRQISILYLIQKSTRNQYLYKEIIHTDKYQFHQKLSVLQSNKILYSHPHLVQLQQFKSITQSQFCTNYHKISLLYDFPHRTFDQQIAQRNLQDQKFQQKQIWTIIASCILGLAHFQKNNKYHKNISTTTIYLHKDGIIKIADPCILELTSNYEKIQNKNNIQHLYLSPQLCKSRLNEEISFSRDINIFKSDVFTLGMVILQAISMKYQDYCYKLDYSYVKMEEITNQINLLKEIYSTQLQLIVKLMLQQQQQKRPDWLQLQTYINKIDQKKQMHQIKQQNNKIIIHPIQKQIIDITQTYNTHQPIVLKHKKPQIVYQTNKVKTKQQNYNQIKPILQSKNIDIKPRAGKVPIPIYNTVTKFDQNLIQITEEQQKLQQMSKQRHLNVNNQIKRTIRNQNQVPGNGFSRLQVSNNKPLYLNGNQSLNYVSPLNNNIINNNYNVTFRLKNQQGVSGLQYADQQYIGQKISNQPYQQFSGNQINNQPFNNQKFNNQQFSGKQINNQPFNNQSFNNQQFIGQQFGIQSRKIINGSLNHMVINNLNINYKNPYKFEGINEVKQIKQLSNNQQININKKQIIPINNHVDKNKYLFTDYNKLQITKIQNPPSNQLLTFQNKINQFKNHQTTFPPNLLNLNIKSANSIQDLKYQTTPKFVIQTYPQGSKYQGQMLNNIRHGKGKFYYKDGGYYEGEWRNNKMNGKGKLYYQSGKLAYDGSWFNSSFFGFGILYNQQPKYIQQGFNYKNFNEFEDIWSRYEGYFINDQKQGEGRLFLTNGEQFRGKFRKDMIDGEGVFIKMDGSQVLGEWVQNIYVQY